MYYRLPGVAKLQLHPNVLIQNFPLGLLIYGFDNKVSLCSLGWLQTHNLLSQPSERWDSRYAPTHQQSGPGLWPICGCAHGYVRVGSTGRELSQMSMLCRILCGSHTLLSLNHWATMSSSRNSLFFWSTSFFLYLLGIQPTHSVFQHREKDTASLCFLNS